MAKIDGDPFSDGDLLSFEEMNRILTSFRGASIPSNLQPGSFFSDSGDDKLYHEGTATPEEILQATRSYDRSVQLGMNVLETKVDSYNVLITDIGKTLIMNAVDKTFSLPSVAADNIGAIIEFGFIGTGKLTIDAADADTIDDSGAGDGIYCEQNGEKYSSITLRLISATAWIILSAKGIWATTE